MTNGKVPGLAVPVKALAEAVLEKAVRLGLTWRLRPATVTSVASDGTIRALHDGDTQAIRVTSMIGAVPVRARVMVLKTPPAGNHIVGLVGSPGAGAPTGPVQKFTADATFVVPAGARWIRAYGVGGGGGGGGVTGATGGNGAGGGGGAGGYCESVWAAAELPAQVAVTVGAAGTAGAAGAAGGAGGNTSFGGLWTASGGSGGGGVTANTTDTSGGRGPSGGGTGGNVRNSAGAAGGPGRTLDGRHVFAAFGGDSMLGAGASAPVSINANGFNAGGPGGGGGGAIAGATARAGGVGGAGLVIVEVVY
ncbi:hypothetical protein AB0N38_30185 [Micromonospora aurantiaca]|uniref:glycine-rich domain-containing protein n=1 Tax=Micromonospora aurantiaca (nom. illeg.) TaxID=47850 RepID=UPI001E48481A|nr:hypothetical protein [Micromonospora aurantiaca]UFN92423.1 hypothetical protein LF814_20695 [Micromonospora aurantiaca]